MSGITLGGFGGDGTGGEVLMVGAFWGSNGAAAGGDAIAGARMVEGLIGRLRPLRRLDWGSCSAVAVAVRQVLVRAAICGGMDPGVGGIGGDGTFRVEVYLSNIFASWRSASSCRSETGAKGDDV